MEKENNSGELAETNGLQPGGGRIPSSCSGCNIPRCKSGDPSLFSEKLGRKSEIMLGYTSWLSRRIYLRPQHKGIHLVTDEVLMRIPELSDFKVGLMSLQLLHTSASLSINENWDPDVRDDMQMVLERLAPDDMIPLQKDGRNGSDELPAHTKSVLIGSNLCIPIRDGNLGLGHWQGIWLCEHRDRAGSRKVQITIEGLKK